jgi:hypothetical protein
MDQSQPFDVLLILTRDTSGHAILIREEAGAGPVLVARWPWRTNRPVPDVYPQPLQAPSGSAVI